MRLIVYSAIVVSVLINALPVQAGIITGPITNPANGNAYYLLTQNTWSDSEAEAGTLGGNLVTISDFAENLWVVSTFADFGGVSRALWIGLNDSAVEGTFVWASGQPVGYTNWGPGEPNNYPVNEDWAHIFPSTDGRFMTWNDAPDAADSFGFAFYGVVEVPGVTSVPEPSSLVLFALAGFCGIGARHGRRRPVA